MTVHPPISIHVMGVSGSMDDRGRKEWLEWWWGEHNYQLGLAGRDEASGVNLPCTLTHAQECLLPRLCVTLPSSLVTVSCVRFSSFISLFSVCEQRLICSQCLVAVPCSLPQYAWFTLANTESQAREVASSTTFCSWSVVSLVVPSAPSCLVLPPPVKSAFTDVTSRKDCSSPLMSWCQASCWWLLKWSQSLNLTLKILSVKQIIAVWKMSLSQNKNLVNRTLAWIEKNIIYIIYLYII